MSAQGSPIPQSPTTPTMPATVDISSPEASPLATPEPIQYEEPLYTEIRIPLPPIPQPSTPPKSRHRAHTLASLSPFHHRSRSSSTATNSNVNVDRPQDSPAAAMMKSLTKGRKRSGTVDALAIVPAVLVLSAELFTPRKDEEKEGGEDGANAT
ncbi:hypothetical protein BCR34DRAFT_603592 [Clohesyomyces aquaticus]|uniref:Uncharacterized protein n=1 Tax=Clohesyomyces aquaticus TaxID=1231657 RepID=A0A1Y1ZDL7_9PLEO|nr:hypothetical protein BCR34DRAFT_603592 [Clohesyomyces aquaticus]